MTMSQRTFFMPYTKSVSALSTERQYVWIIFEDYTGSLGANHVNVLSPVLTNIFVSDLDDGNGKGNKAESNKYV